MKKYILIFASLVLTMILLTGCALSRLTPTGSVAQDKSFSKSGMTIVLTDSFYEKSHVSFTACYESKNLAVFTLKEEFEYFQNDMTLAEYAQLVVDVNGLDAEVVEKEELTAFEFQQELHGKNYKYFVSVYKGTDAYWLVQFACETKHYDKLLPQIIKFAQSVEV